MATTSEILTYASRRSTSLCANETAKRFSTSTKRKVSMNKSDKHAKKKAMLFKHPHSRTPKGNA